ncbi:hypothetical protein SUGI_0754120 [Cryptomeria japonica]|nr:hypothetical protein SUGI_0754120 [Cryptomeria japonica]
MVSKRNWTDMFKVQPSTSINQGKSRSSLNRGGQELRNPEPKARWNPKKEQIEILESIYTSGKIRPSRDDIRMIRIQLLEFGEVEEANIFYWFQNRKSKNRKRQRLLVAGTANPIQTSTANPIQTMEKSSFPSLSPSISSFPNHQTQRVSADTHINLQQGGLSSGSTTYPYKYNSAISSFPQNYSSFLLPEKQSDPFNHYQRPEAAIPSALTDTNPDTRHLGGPVNVRNAFSPNVIMVDTACQRILTNESGFSLHGLQEGGDYYLLNKTGGAAPLLDFLKCRIS